MSSKAPVEITELYYLAEEVRPFIDALIEYFPIFDHLKDEILISLFFAAEAPKVRGRTAMALVTMPDAQGQNKHVYSWALFMAFGFEPDVVMIIHHESWDTADDYQKLALLYHELRHIYQKTTQSGGPQFSRETGRPIYELRDHQLGLFYDELETFGAWDAAIAEAKALLDKETRFNIGPLMELVEAKRAAKNLV